MTKAEQIARLRKATGLGWLEARLFLANRSAELCSRIVEAKENQRDRNLHDPIEDNPAFSQRISDAKAKAEAALRQHIAERNANYIQRGWSHMVSEHPRGSCYFLWRETKQILAREGIAWFSPAEMNPGTIFD
jgi:hypothetical protein